MLYQWQRSKSSLPMQRRRRRTIAYLQKRLRLAPCATTCSGSASIHVNGPRPLDTGSEARPIYTIGWRIERGSRLASCLTASMTEGVF